MAVSLSGDERAQILAAALAEVQSGRFFLTWTPLPRFVRDNLAQILGVAQKAPATLWRTRFRQAKPAARDAVLKLFRIFLMHEFQRTLGDRLDDPSLEDLRESISDILRTTPAELLRLHLAEELASDTKASPHIELLLCVEPSLRLPGFPQLVDIGQPVSSDLRSLQSDAVAASTRVAGDIVAGRQFANADRQTLDRYAASFAAALEAARNLADETGIAYGDTATIDDIDRLNEATAAANGPAFPAIAALTAIASHREHKAVELVRTETQRLAAFAPVT